ncbi:MAG: hypothetical protein HQM08_21045 [Candidatus Riflebacteria bacterium]|nr:hypothetical protein [Candidatus Riflebacteria bacterium]
MTQVSPGVLLNGNEGKNPDRSSVGCPGLSNRNSPNMFRKQRTILGRNREAVRGTGDENDFPKKSLSELIA